MFYRVERIGKKLVLVFNGIRVSKYNTNFDDYSKM